MAYSRAIPFPNCSPGPRVLLLAAVPTETELNSLDLASKLEDVEDLRMPGSLRPFGRR